MSSLKLVNEVYNIVYTLKKMKDINHLNVDIIDEDGQYPSKRDYFFKTINEINREMDEYNHDCIVTVYFGNITIADRSTYRCKL